MAWKLPHFKDLIIESICVIAPFHAVFDILCSHLELLEQPTSSRSFVWLCFCQIFCRKIMALIWNRHAQVYLSPGPNLIQFLNVHALPVLVFLSPSKPRPEAGWSNNNEDRSVHFILYIYEQAHSVSLLIHSTFHMLFSSSLIDKHFIDYKFVWKCWRANLANLFATITILLLPHLSSIYVLNYDGCLGCQLFVPCDK